MSGSPVKTFDFTISCKLNPIENVGELLKKHCSWWCFQQEVGEGGFEHYQGRMKLVEKTRLTGAVKLFPGWHLSITNKKAANSKTYVTKEETRIKGPWCSEDGDNNPLFIPFQAEIETLFPWQERILKDSLPGARDARTINLIYDPVGNIGKTAFCLWMESKNICVNIPPLSNYKDMMQMVMNEKVSTLYVIDLPRAMNKTNMNDFWSAIETIKGGRAFDLRYKYRKRIFHSPNIWVFSNSLPEHNSLSPDRWKIWSVVNNELVQFGSKPVTSHVEDFQALRCNSVPENPLPPNPPIYNFTMVEPRNTEDKEHDNIKICDNIYTADGFLNL